MVTTLACVFVVLWTFGQREMARSWSRPSVHRRAWRTLAAGLICLLLYVAVYLAAANDFYWSALRWESGDLRRMLGDMVVLVLYAASFSLLTRSFVLVARASRAR